MRCLACLVIFFIVLSSKAQEIVVEDKYDDFFGPKPAFVFSFRSSLNTQAVNIGLELGRMNANRNFMYSFSFDARPYRRPILVYQGSNLYYQLREERYFIGGGAEYSRQFAKKRFGTFAQMNVDFTWGNYAGSEQAPPKGWVLLPRMGLSYQTSKHTSVKLGYCYMDAKTRGLENHRIFLAYNIIGGR